MQHQQWQRCCCVVSCPLFKPPEGSQSLVYVFFPLNLIRGCILFSKIDVTLLCWTKHIFWAGVWLTAVFHTRVWSFLILMMLSDVSGCFSRECFSLIVHLCVTITSQNSCTLRAKFSRQSGSHLHSYWSTRQMWFSGWMYVHMHTHDWLPVIRFPGFFPSDCRKQGFSGISTGKFCGVCGVIIPVS